MKGSGVTGGETGRIIYTVGHSVRSIEEFLSLMIHYQIETVADVRTLPGSRRVPQFNGEHLDKTLQAAGMDYRHFKLLGGLRHTTRDSFNTAWRNKSFRGFADYMQTAAFLEGLQALVELSLKKTTVMMCAEAVPWRCHRSLIGDALLVRSFQVMDIFSETSVKPHTLTSFAVVEGTKVTYPAEA